jgi:hypothetical protein
MWADEKVFIRVSEEFAISIFAFLPTPKCDLVEVEKAMFKVTSYPLYLIFYFLTKRKLDLREVEKDVSRVRLALGEVGRAMFRVNSRPCNYFSASLEHITKTYLTSRKGIFREFPSLKNSFCAFGPSKMSLGRVRVNYFQGDNWP